ncbi:methyltransferase domain-containing protein [Methylobacterium sp. E-046]|uniref:class I SAM-dependent methyltransferase n=1 Tax=Methylobacterium sp. E-046 TaxID=2836576 RepID=UPI001FBB399A|nr:class I SAM-dependent methyltransferase [Methylobacterium sp. E-046]
MNRTQRLLRSLPRDARLVEVGPSFAPLAPKREGWNTFVIDHASRDDLVAKYTAHHGVDTTRIEEVDFVWQGGSLADAVPADQHGTFDAFIASHVIEHTTDVVTFLQAAETLIRPDGVIILAVPDKRKCFDFYRHPSTTGDALAAFLEKRARHDTRTHFESVMRTIHKGGAPGWPGDDTREGVIAIPFDKAHEQLALAGLPEYVDAHNWIFVPSSFRLMLLELAAMGYLDLRVDEIAEAEATEFYAWLRRGRVPMEAAELQTARRHLMDRIIVELSQQLRQLPEALRSEDGPEAQFLNGIKEADFRTEATQIVLAAVLASTGWRGLNRRKFRRLIAEASRSIPVSGPAAVQHLVLLEGAQKVLGSDPAD